MRGVPGGQNPEWRMASLPGWMRFTYLTRGKKKRKKVSRENAGSTPSGPRLRSEVRLGPSSSAPGVADTLVLL